MSTLFDTYYDSFGHELHLGDTVMGCTIGGKVYGHIIDFKKDAKGNDKYTITADIGYANISPEKRKRTYKINSRNVYLIIIKR